MSPQSLSPHLDPATLDGFRSLAEAEGRPVGQILTAALRSLLEQSPAARRALVAIDETADDAGRAFAARVIGRSVLRAHEGILDARRVSLGIATGTNAALVDEATIEAEAVRMCRR